MDVPDETMRKHRLVFTFSRAGEIDFFEDVALRLSQFFHSLGFPVDLYKYFRSRIISNSSVVVSFPDEGTLGKALEAKRMAGVEIQRYLGASEPTSEEENTDSDSLSSGSDDDSFEEPLPPKRQVGKFVSPDLSYLQVATPLKQANQSPPAEVPKPPGTAIEACQSTQAEEPNPKSPRTKVTTLAQQINALADILCARLGEGESARLRKIFDAKLNELENIESRLLVLKNQEGDTSAEKSALRETKGLILRWYNLRKEFYNEVDINSAHRSALGDKKVQLQPYSQRLGAKIFLCFCETEDPRNALIENYREKSRLISKTLFGQLEDELGELKSDEDASLIVDSLKIFYTSLCEFDLQNTVQTVPSPPCGTFGDVFVIRPFELLRKMFDELTCGLHWLIFRKILLHDGLVFTANQELTLSGKTEYGYPIVSMNTLATPKPYNISNLQDFQNHVGSWDCGRLLRHIDYTAKKIPGIYSNQPGSSTVLSATEKLLALRHALFHRYFLADPSAQKKVIDSIQEISWMMQSLLNDDMIEDTKDDRLVEPIKRHREAINRMGQVGNRMSRQPVSKSVTEKCKILLDAIQGDDPDVLKGDHCLSFWFTNIVAPRFRLQSGSPAPDLELPDEVDPVIEKLSFNVEKAFRYSFESTETLTIERARQCNLQKKEIVIDDTWGATNADLLNRIWDEMSLCLVHAIATSPEPSIEIAFDSSKVKFDGTVRVAAGDLRLVKKRRKDQRTEDEMPTFAKKLENKDKSKPSKNKREKRIKKLYQAYEPKTLLEFVKGRLLISNCVSEANIASQMLGLRHTLSHQYYLCSPHSLSINLVRSLAVDARRVVEAFWRKICRKDATSLNKSDNYRNLIHLEACIPFYDDFRRKQGRMSRLIAAKEKGTLPAADYDAARKQNIYEATEIFKKIAANPEAKACYKVIKTCLLQLDVTLTKEGDKEVHLHNETVSNTFNLLRTHDIFVPELAIMPKKVEIEPTNQAKKKRNKKKKKDPKQL